MGSPNLLWEDFIPKLKTSVSALGTPSIVFIHIGSSDLGKKKDHEKLKSHVISDLSQIAKTYLNTAFIWSGILPRKQWLSSGLEDIRKELNVDVSIRAREFGFRVSSLRLVEEMTLEKFRKKTGSYSWDYIYGVFNTYVKEAVAKEIKKIKGAN